MGKTKAKTGEKKKVVEPTRYFAFAEHTDVKDLQAAPLVIQQVTAFIPEGKDEESVTLEIWELRGNHKEKEPFELLKVSGKVKKADGFSFTAEKVEQDPKKFPKPKNAKGTELWLPAKLEIRGLDGKKRGLGETGGIEFVLPPLEYDDTLELQLGSTLPGSANGQAKITWSTFAGMKGALAIDDQTAGIPRGEAQTSNGGNLKAVVVHCMCAVLVTGDKPSESFDIARNLKIFKDAGNLSAHYLIGRDGKITQAVDEHIVAHHAWSSDNVNLKRGANQLTIGIELIGFADGFRKSTEEKYEKAQKKLEKDKKPFVTERETYEKALAKREKEKADGVEEVQAGKEKMTVDEAIRRIKAAIAGVDAKIGALTLSDWALDYEKLVKEKVPGGTAKAFTYTDAQYEALGKLLEVFGRRYGYQLVCSHHWINPDAKTDPGIHFDWGRLTPYLLPGSLEGDEEGDGGVYTVET